MMFKTSRLIVILMVVALLVPAFGVAQAQDCTFEDETIRYGAIVPLSAPGAVVGGVAMQWAAQRAAEDINSNCGIQVDGKNYRVEILVGDSEGLPERGQAVAERLIFENNVDGMVGVYHSAVGLATMGIMHANQVPTVYSEPWNDNVSANGIQEYEGSPPRIETDPDGLDYIFRVSPASSMTSIASFEWLAHLGVTDLVIVAENTDYGIGAAESDLVQAEIYGIEAEVLYIELGTEDFVPILSRIQARATPPQAVKTLITGETSYNFTQQMAELGIAPNDDTICITNQVAFQSEQYWRNVPDGNYCTFFRVGITPALYNEITQALAEAYREAFRDEIPSYALETYDSVRLLADAMQRAGSFTDGPAIVRALEASDIELAQGRYWFKYGSHNPEIEEGDPAYMWHQWPDPAVTQMQYFEVGQAGVEAAVIWPPVYQTHGTAYIPVGSTP